MASDPDRLSKVVFIGIGGGGVSMLESWLDKLPADALCIALDRDGKHLHRKKKFEYKLALFNIKSLGSTVEYAESVRAEIEKSVDDKMPELIAKFQERNRIVLLAGLGGVIGTWASQTICNRLIAMNKQVVTVLVMPFGFERERMKVAEYALPSFDGAAHQVLCFNDYLIKHTSENTSMADAFEIMNEKAFELFI